MLRWRVVFLITLLTLSFSVSASGQGDPSTCSPVVAAAMAAAQQLCAATGRNEICYGNDQMRAQPENLFTVPGDIAPVDLIQALSLSALDETANVWGVALAKLQVNLPDALPGTNITFLLYGDVQFAPVPGEAGSPIQAFRLETGIGGTECGATTMNGLLVQTPEGSEKASFTINGVEVRMGSTIQFMAQPNERMTVRAVEGAVLARFGGVSSLAVAGTEVGIPLDEDLQPAGEPELPEAYELEEVEALPIDPLERDFEIAEPLDEDELIALQDFILENDFDDDAFDQWFDDGDYEAFFHSDDEDDGEFVDDGESGDDGGDVGEDDGADDGGDAGGDDGGGDDGGGDGE